MPEKQLATIRSLSSFFKLIEDEQLDNYIFRGENKLFQKRDASAYRLRGAEGDEGHKYDTPRIYDEYKNRVIGGLTQLELTHFSAFIQHHGAPTSLLDFTYSPLVALYFACRDGGEKTGYIYLIGKKRTLDITSILTNCNHNELNSLLLDLFNEKYNEEYDSFKQGLSKYFRENEGKISELLLELINNYEPWKYKLTLDQYPETRNYSLQSLRKHLQNNPTEPDLYEYITHIYPLLREEKYTESKWSKPAYPAAELYPLLLRQYLFNAIHYNNRHRESPDKIKYEFNCDIVFTYSPPNIFKRLESQQALFVHQLNLSKSSKNRVISRQGIRVDFSIRIQNKKQILRQLDLMGINEASLFNDYDSIARHIKNKYGMSEQKEN